MQTATSIKQSVSKNKRVESKEKRNLIDDTEMLMADETLNFDFQTNLNGDRLGRSRGHVQGGLRHRWTSSISILVNPKLIVSCLGNRNLILSCLYRSTMIQHVGFWYCFVKKKPFRHWNLKTLHFKLVALIGASRHSTVMALRREFIGVHEDTGRFIRLTIHLDVSRAARARILL